MWSIYQQFWNVSSIINLRDSCRSLCIWCTHFDLLFLSSVVDTKPPEVFNCPKTIEIARGREKYVQVNYTVPYATDPSGPIHRTFNKYQRSGSYFPTNTKHSILYMFCDSAAKANCGSCTLEIVFTWYVWALSLKEIRMRFCTVYITSNKHLVNKQAAI